MYTPKFLGKTTDYPMKFDASLLEAIPRSFGRQEIGIQSELPFLGQDVWQAYELSWLNQRGQSIAGVVDLQIPVASPAIVESKSFKLYLQSFHMMTFVSQEQVQAQIFKDLTALLQYQIIVRVQCLSQCARNTHDGLWNIQLWQDKIKSKHDIHYINLDKLDFECSVYTPNKQLLKVDTEVDTEHNNALMYLTSDCFRSLCPVTGQPDFASVVVVTEGVHVSAVSLGQYLNSYRLHQGFHEQCIETIFLDLLGLGQFKKLSVIGRFTRRGGIDINPERHLNASSIEAAAGLQLRQIRQ